MTNESELTAWYWGLPIVMAILGAMAGAWVYFTFPLDHPGVVMSWLIVPFVGGMGLLVGLIGDLAIYGMVDPRSF